MRTASSLALLAALAVAQDSDDAAAAAEEVAAAVAAGDDAKLKEIAVRPRPDPWRVAEHLRATQRSATAVAYARLLSGPEHARLAAYVTEGGGAVAEILAAERKAKAALTGRRFADALVRFRKLADRTAELGWIRRAQWHLERAAAAGRRAGDHRAVEEVTVRLVAVARLRKNPDALGGALNNRGAFLFDQSRLAEAEACFLEARATLKDRAGSQTLYAHATMNVANVRQRNGDYEAALPLLEEARGLLERAGAKRSLAVLLMNLSWVLDELGKWHEQQALLERALELAGDIREPGLEAFVRMGFGHVLKRQSDLARARAVYDEAAQLYDKVGDRGRAAYARSAMASCFVRPEDMPKARQLLEAALAELDRVGMRAEAADTAVSLASCAWDAGRFEDAHRLARTAKARYLALGLPMQHNLARLLSFTASQRGDHDEAVNLSRAQWSEAVTPAGRARAGEALASALNTAGRLEEAVQIAREAAGDVLLVSSGWADAVTAGMRTERGHLYDVGLTAAVQADRFDDAVHFLELRRAGALLEGLKVREKLGSLLPAELRKSDEAARAQVRKATAAYRRARQSGRRKAIAEARHELDRSRKRLRDAERRVQTEAKALASVTHPQPATRDQLQRLLAPSEAFLWVSEIRHQHGDNWGVVAVLTKEYGFAVDVARVPRPDEDPAVLRKLLFEQLNMPKTIRRVLVSPDGAFTFLPYARLLPGIDVAYVPSGTTLQVLREQAGGERGRGVLALGDPAYDAPAPGSGGTRGSYARLPATGDEARAVGDVVLLRERATVTGLKKALATRPRWRAVHLACHGRADSANPLESALALTGGDLTAGDVFRIRIPADLAVLSACETARGKVYRAEGVVGLTRAFLYAGPPRVIVSQWKVDDEATRALMIRFYAEWKKGRPAATALRLAREHVAAQPRWKAPKFWAAWQLWGLPD